MLLFVYLLAHFIIAVRRVYLSGWPLVVFKSTVVLSANMIVVLVVIENAGNLMVIAD